MSEYSQYVFECICGAKVKSPVEHATCTSCGRTLIVENWGKPELAGHNTPSHSAEAS